MGRKKTTRPAKKNLSGKNRRQNAPNGPESAGQPRAVQLLAAGQLDAARKAAEEWATQEPDASLPWNILGGVESLLENQAAAAAAFRKAVARAPEDAEVRSNLARALALQGLYAEGLEQAREALRLQPDLLGAETNLGHILRELGEPDQAAAAYRRALAHNPSVAEAHLGLGNALLDANKPEEAEEAYRQAAELAPSNAEAFVGLGTAFIKLGAAREAIAAYREALAIAPFYPVVHSDLLLYLHYDPDQTQNTIFDEHVRWAQQQAGDLQAKPLTFTQSSTPYDKPLTIGLVGPKFKKHPSLWLALGALEALTARGHHLLVYSHASDAQEADEFTERLANIAQKWRSIAFLDDTGAAETIRADAPDIVINMVGHGESRMRIFAQRVAPIQVQWKGYNTTGLATMDWFLGDWVEIPPGEEQWFTEQVYRLPDDYIAYLPPDDAPAVGPLPMKEHAEGPTFGSFNNPAKVNEQIAAVWARILGHVPGSRLLLKGGAFDHPQACQRIRNMFAEQGVDSDRLILEGPAPHDELLDTYNRMDIALDTWPYSGGLTTLEALWMGVPVITLPGPTFAGRHSATHLVNAGLSELVATDADDYVTKAVAWADDPEGLAQLRGSLRDQLAQSPVCDQERFTNNLEEALRYMIHQGLGGS